MTSRVIGCPDRYAIGILLLLVVISWAPRLRGPIDLRWDAAAYYILGTALAEGRGYRLLNEPGEIRAILFPPLLPAIVAVHQRALGTGDPVVVGASLRMFFFLLSAAFVTATYLLLRRVARAPSALAGTLVVSLTFPHLWLSDRCYTDLPFALTCVIFVLVQPHVNTAKRDVLCGAVAAAAFLLRTAGAALFIAWVLEAILARNYRRAAARVLLALVPISAWQLHVHQVVTGPEYVKPAYVYQRADYNIYNVTYGQLFSLRDHLNPSLGTATASEYAGRLPRMVGALVPGLGGAISVPAAEWADVMERLKRIPVLRLVPWRTIDIALLTLGALVLIGIATQLRAGELRGAITSLVYLGALCTMPLSYFNELPRYLTAIAPLLMVSAYHAVAAVGGLRPRVPPSVATTATASMMALALVVLSLGGFSVWRGYSEQLSTVVHRNWSGRHVEYRLFTYGEDYQWLDQALEWLQANASPDDVVATTTPHWVYLRTGLRAVMPPFEADPGTARTLLDSVPTRYVVVADWLSRRYALPAVGNVWQWHMVYSTPDCTIYERLPAQ